jgi:glycerophosphoryl diester phosphodiesterase
VQERISPLIDAQITFAHRGARAHLQENTIAAFELALRLGATGLESDTWITRDGVAVLDHDGIVKSRLRNKPISNFNRAELPNWIPTLADLYQRCGTDAHLSLDIKDVNSMDDVVHTMFTRGNPSKTWLCHPDLAFLESWVGRVHGAHLVHSTRLKAMAPSDTLQCCGIKVFQLSTCLFQIGMVDLLRYFTGSTFTASDGIFNIQKY